MKDPRSKKAIAAGLSLTLALGSVPAVAFADNAGEGNDGDAAQQGSLGQFTFNANGGQFADGSTTSVINGNEGDCIYPEPTRAGYTFKGWYLYPDMSQIPENLWDYNMYKPTAPQAGNWYAAWEKDATATQSIEVVSHFVGGDRDGSSETTVVEVPAGSYVSDCVKGEVEGYTAETIVSGVATSAVEVYMTSSLEGVTTLNVYYKANEQKDQNEANVTFFANGGKFVDGNDYMVGVTASDGTMPQPPAPTREGYTFAGWYWHADYSNYTDEQKEADKVDFSKPVEKGGSMFAQWTKNEAAKTKVEVVSFFQGGDRDGSNVIANVEVTPDSSVADCVQTFDGYHATKVVSGVATSEVEVNMTSSLEGITTLYVYYEADKVEEQKEIPVTYVANGGQFADGQEVQRGLTDSEGFMRQPAAPTREGYTFAGWYWVSSLDGLTDEQKELNKVDFEQSVAGKDHVTMFAQWTKDAEQENLFNVMYVANGGQFFTGEDVQQGVTDSEGVMRQPLAPTREGYTFEGWYWHSDYTNYTEEQKALDKVDFTAPIDRDAVMYAQWTKNAEQNEIDVLYVANGGQFATGETFQQGMTDSEGFMRQPAAPTREGYTFAGWYWVSSLDGLTDEQKELNKVDFEQSVAGKDHVTMFAQWTKDAEQENLFNVMYVANGGQFFTGEDVQQGVTDSEGVMRQPLAPTREGYTFEGWYWHSDYTNYTEEQKALDKVDFTAPIDRDAVMYAQWSKVVTPAEKKITVKFVDNFNKTESTVEINEGEAVAQPKDPSYKGWSFEGWSSTLTDEQGNAKFTPVDFSKVVADEDEDGVVTYYAFYTEDKAETPAETEKKDEPKQETTEEDAPAAEEPAAEAEAAAIPQTGDATNTAAVAGVAGIAGLLAAAAALIRRRFNN